jgi:hypothetical protein
MEIPYEGTHISGLLVRAEGVKGPTPILVQLNGLDSTKEMKYLVGLAGWLAGQAWYLLADHLPARHGRSAASAQFGGPP